MSIWVLMPYLSFLGTLAEQYILCHLFAPLSRLDCTKVSLEYIWGSILSVPQWTRCFSTSPWQKHIHSVLLCAALSKCPYGTKQLGNIFCLETHSYRQYFPPPSLSRSCHSECRQHYCSLSEVPTSPTIPTFHTACKLYPKNSIRYSYSRKNPCNENMQTKTSINFIDYVSI